MPQDPPVTVTRQLDARMLLPDTTHVDFLAQLSYDSMDPYAVTATFLCGDGLDVDWVLARDLLADGLRRPAGDGDVILRPSTGQASTEVELILSAPNGQALLSLPKDGLAAFLRASHHEVPPGTESERLDVDAALAQILSN